METAYVLRSSFFNKNEFIRTLKVSSEAELAFLRVRTFEAALHINFSHRKPIQMARAGHPIPSCLTSTEHPTRFDPLELLRHNPQTAGSHYPKFWLGLRHLNGPLGGNAGYSQGVSDGVPRQRPTRPMSAAPTGRLCKYSFGGRVFEILGFFRIRERSGDARLSEGEQCFQRSANIAWKQQDVTGRSTCSDMRVIRAESGSRTHLVLIAEIHETFSRRRFP